MQDITIVPPSTKKRGPSFTAEQIIEALTKSKGMVYLAAKLLDCDPSTIHRRAKTNKQIIAAIDASRGELIDVAEVALMAAVQAKQPWAIAFTLKTIGKHRGYIEKQEISFVAPEQVDAAIEHELARLAAPSEAIDAGAVEVEAITIDA